MRDELACRIEKLCLKPGDVLVVRLDLRATHQLMALARDFVTTQVGGDVKVLVIDRGFDLSVLTKEEIERRASNSGQ